jgi:hypothetical protein
VKEVEIQRASNLGPVQQKLGLDPNARICCKVTSIGVTVWDISTGTVYLVDGKTRTVTHIAFTLPTAVKTVIALSDEELKARWSHGWRQGWDDNRQTIFTELIFRGISVFG